MHPHPSISFGQFTHPGIKTVNQDFHGLQIPDSLESKGIVAAIADGISSSSVSHIAAESAVKSFMTDFFATPDAWSVKTSGERVFKAINAWLHGQTQSAVGRLNKDLGYICTLSVLVLQSRTAHIFHAGDSRIYRVEGNSLEQLTRDHRLIVDSQESYLSRALGCDPNIEVEYHKTPLSEGDIFIMSTDGVHEYWDSSQVGALIKGFENNLSEAAKRLVERSMNSGSQDNLSVQIIRIDHLPPSHFSERHHALLTTPAVKELRVGSKLDGYTVLRDLHSSHRSHVYLAKDDFDSSELVIKIPATDHRADAAALERLLSEEWIARRLNNPHLLKAHPQRVNRSRLYVALEYVKGETLAQRIRDNTRLKIDEVRDLSEQLMQGIQAMHRSEIIHQDIRAENIIIDEHGTLKLIDFGSSFCGSWFDLEEEKHTDFQPLGTEQFSAPESILGQIPTVQSDIFCVGVLVYYMLSARLPYGAQVARIKTPDEILRLQYIPLKEHGVSVPDWFEQAIRKALAPQARQRYTEVSEFAWDLRHPNPKFVGMRAPPLVEQHPILIWKLSSALLLLLLIMSIYLR